MVREIKENERDELLALYLCLHEKFMPETTERLENTWKTILKDNNYHIIVNEVGNKMGLPFHLTMHVARHTFAVMALNRGVTIHMISRLLGHSSIITTEKVYAEFLPDTVTEEVKNKLSFGYMPSF